MAPIRLEILSAMCGAGPWRCVKIARRDGSHAPLVLDAAVARCLASAPWCQGTSERETRVHPRLRAFLPRAATNGLSI